METRLKKLSHHSFFIGSYRTYEEWKHSLIHFFVHRNMSSYRTYEEWKLSRRTFLCVPCISSYRTYEEWKPFEPPTLV